MKNKTQINKLIEECKDNANNHGWVVAWSYKDEHISEFVNDEEQYKILSVGEALCLCHSELSEALEAYRDDNKNHFCEEIADEFIRLFDLCGDLNIDIEKAIEEKMNKNRTRPKNHGRVNF